MVDKITNNVSNRTHPLFNLLLDCIVANGGGSTSQNLCKAMAAKGWSQSFVGWEGGKSIEELTFTPEAFEALKQIYMP